ncbi:MAG: GerMN domain-containing protein [Clostridia bacterium]|nr:GerMN domain-containing protein [Clostridia bacterium]
MMLKWLKKIRMEDAERALILCASAMVVALALKGEAPASARYEDDLKTNLPVINVQENPSVPTRETVVFYQDGEGYLVPVTCEIPEEEGIAKATLSKMVASSENDLYAARLGLKTTLPEGTNIELDIADQKARVDLSKEALSCQSAEEESLMIQSVVETLCRFDTVEEVDFLFDGQKRSKLTFGSDVSGVFKGGSVNFESTDTVPTAGAGTVQLYFPSSSGRMLVPVTRTVYSPADETTAILELIKGPKPDSGLDAALPDTLGVKSVTQKDGVVTVDFTKEFAAVMEQDTAQLALNAVLYTLRQFPDVKDIQFQVEGKPFAAPQEVKATSLNLSSEIISYYPGVIETD